MGDFCLSAPGNDRPDLDIRFIGDEGVVPTFASDNPAVYPHQYGRKIIAKGVQDLTDREPLVPIQFLALCSNHSSLFLLR